jgi:hypothetical protein
MVIPEVIETAVEVLPVLMISDFQTFLSELCSIR